MTNMPEIDYAALGKRIARYRKLNGLTVAVLATAVGGGLSRETLSQIESGRRTALDLRTVLAICWQLGIPPISIFWETRAVNKTTTELLKWFEAEDDWSPLDAAQAAGMSVTALREFVKAERRLRHWQEARIAGDEDPEFLKRIDEQIDMAKIEMRIAKHAINWGDE